MAQAKQNNQAKHGIKLFELTWQSNDSPVRRTEYQSGHTHMEARGAIRHREYTKAGVKRFIEVKEVPYEDVIQMGIVQHSVAG